MQWFGLGCRWTSKLVWIIPVVKVGGPPKVGQAPREWVAAKKRAPFREGGLELGVEEPPSSVYLGGQGRPAVWLHLYVQSVSPLSTHVSCLCFSHDKHQWLGWGIMTRNLRTYSWAGGKEQGPHRAWGVWRLAGEALSWAGMLISSGRHSWSGWAGQHWTDS